jgi:hypothetical protein
MTYVIECLMPGNYGTGYVGWLTHRGGPTYVMQLARARRFTTAREAQLAAGQVPPALEPLLVRISEEG